MRELTQEHANNAYDTCRIRWVANDRVWTSCDEFVVLAKGKLESVQMAEGTIAVIANQALEDDEYTTDDERGSGFCREHSRRGSREREQRLVRIARFCTTESTW